MVGIDVLGGAIDSNRALFSETEVRIGGIMDPRFMQRALRRGNMKYIQRPTGPECYNLAGDRGEQNSNCTSASQQSSAEKALSRWGLENESLAAEFGEAEGQVINLEQLERLKAIGYAQ
jgi:hypothetical protein